MSRRQGRRNTANGYIETRGSVTLHHIEVEGCIVNIREGLKGEEDRPTTVVEVIPDEYAGDTWKADGSRVIRVVKEGA